MKINANALQRPESYDSKKADLQREQLGTFPLMTRCQKRRTDALSLLSKYYHLTYRWYCHSNILCQNAFDILMSPKIPFCLSKRLDCIAKIFCEITMKYKIYISHILITKIASTCSYSHCYIDDVANAFLFWRLSFHLWVSRSCISRGADNFYLRNSLLEMIYSYLLYLTWFHKIVLSLESLLACYYNDRWKLLLYTKTWR